MPQNRNHENFKGLCSVHHCRCTAQRFAVFECVCGKTGHPSVDHVWRSVKRKLPSITRESVFRILTEFTQWGLIFRMDKIENARFDGIPGNHGHLICDMCGQILDFPLPQELKIPKELSKFKTEHIELRISGLCADCQKKTKKLPPVRGTECGRNRKK